MPSAVLLQLSETLSGQPSEASLPRVLLPNLPRPAKVRLRLKAPLLKVAVVLQARAKGEARGPAVAPGHPAPAEHRVVVRPAVLPAAKAKNQIRSKKRPRLSKRGLFQVREL